MKAAAVIAVLSMMLCAPSTLWAEGDDLNRARQHLMDMEFEKAAELLEALRESGTQAPAELARNYALSARIAGSMGQESEALRFFGRWLVLRPDASLDESDSPKIRELLAQARAASEPLGWSASVRDAEIFVSLTKNPGGLVTSFRVSPAGMGSQESWLRPAETDQRFPVPPGSYQVALLDEWGNTIATKELERAAQAQTIVRAQAPGKAPLYRQWKPWAIGAGGSAVLALGFGALAQRAQSDLDALTASSESTDFRDAAKVEKRLRSRASVTNIALVLTAVTGAASAYFYFQNADEGPKLDVSASEEAVALGVRTSF